MGIITVFTKSLATAAAANNIAASQSPGAAALLLNGAATNYLSTTTTAAVAAGGVVLPLTSVTGVVVGQSVSDNTNSSIPVGTVVAGVGTTTVTLSRPVGGTSGVGNGDTIVFAGLATIDAVTSTNQAIGRKVILTSGGNDSGITFTIVGTNSTGSLITDVVTGTNAGAAQSNLDFVTVASITPSAAIASTITAGTNSVGASPWIVHNYRGYSPMNLGFAVEIVSGAVNYTVQHTYDSPNFLPAGVPFPIAFNDLTLTSQNATMEAALSTPVIASRFLINSGTGVARFRIIQAGVG